MTEQEFDKLSPEQKMALMRQAQQSKQMKVGYGSTTSPYAGGKPGESRQAVGPEHAPADVPAQQGMRQGQSQILPMKAAAAGPTMESTALAGAQTTSTATPAGGSAYGGLGTTANMAGYVPQSLEAASLASQGAAAAPASASAAAPAAAATPAASGGAGASGLAAAGPWAALAAAVVANESQAKGTDRRADGTGEYIGDMLTGAVGAQDGKYMGDKVGGPMGSLMTEGSRMSEDMMKVLKPWEWFT